MEEDGFISNITIGNVISKQKKSAFDKKKEKKMRYLEKKQFKKQNRRNNDNNSEKKIFKNESNIPKRINKYDNNNKNKNIEKQISKEKYKEDNKKNDINNNKEKKLIVKKLEENEDNKNENKHEIKKEIEKEKIIKRDNIQNILNKEDNNNIQKTENINSNKEEINEISKEEPKDNKEEIINKNKEIKKITKETISETKKNTSQTIFSIKTFDDLKINPYLKRALNKNNYTTMTKIQKKAIPILLEHKNVIVKSETGSGKTLAYIIPLYQNLIEINEINKISRKDGIYSVIFSPTHELCLQIEKTFDKLKSCCINVVFGAMMGGQKIDTEKKKIRKGLNVIISTPGRLLYHLRNTGNLNFSKLKTIIIDEADLMLDMGFEKDIKECFKLILKKSENENEYNEENVELNPDLFKRFKIYLISATIDNRIRKMSNYFMKGFKAIGFEKEEKDNKEDKEENKKEDIEEKKNKKDIDINNNDENEKYKINNQNNYLSSLKQQNITQFYTCIYDEYRLVHLIAFLYNNFQSKTIIFVSTCDLCEYLSKLITEIEIDINNNINNNTNTKNQKSTKASSEKYINLFSQKTYKLHGKMKHDERKIVFNDFNEDNTGILIATDVASRGLDFKDVEWIIHYDINPEIKEYVNRIGRTARIDNTGNSILFLMKNEMKLLDTCFTSIKDNLNEMKNSDILINFMQNINKNILQTKIDENFFDKKNIDEDDILDENELYRKKYGNIINTLIRCIKNFVFKEKNNLILARKAFKSEIRAYPTFFKYGKDIFNINTLNLTRISRSFGLYKESLSMKVGDEQVNINYQTDRKEKYTQKKFLNKKIQNRLIYSEFE